MKKYWLTIICVVALVLVSAAAIAVKLFSSVTEKPPVTSRSGTIETQQRQALRPHAEGSDIFAGAGGSESVVAIEPNDSLQWAGTTSVDDADGRIRKAKAQKARKTYPSRSLLNSDSSEGERARQLLQSPLQLRQNEYSLTERGTAFEDSSGALAPELIMDLVSVASAPRFRAQNGTKIEGMDPDSSKGDSNGATGTERINHEFIRIFA